MEKVKLYLGAHISLEEFQRYSQEGLRCENGIIDFIQLHRNDGTNFDRTHEGYHIGLTVTAVASDELCIPNLRNMMELGNSLGVNSLDEMVEKRVLVYFPKKSGRVSAISVPESQDPLVLMGLL